MTDSPETDPKAKKPIPERAREAGWETMTPGARLQYLREARLRQGKASAPEGAGRKQLGAPGDLGAMDPETDPEQEPLSTEEQLRRCQEELRRCQEQLQPAHRLSQAYVDRVLKEVEKNKSQSAGGRKRRKSKRKSKNRSKKRKSKRRRKSKRK